MRSRDPRYWLSTLIMLAAGIGTAAAATLNVAAGGIDAAACGTKTAPCRSLGRAIANAAPGDKILVGPGRYGDLDADGTLGEPGEELGTGGTLVSVDRTLTIESVEGAATTILDAGGANLSVVTIDASGVIFGKVKKGFTVARGGINGVFIAPGATAVTVSGVRAVGNRNGFASKSPGLVFRGDAADANGQDGFVLTGGRVTITGCRATGNGTSGFEVRGNGSLLKANVATANTEAGFDLAAADATTTLTGSVAAGNAIGLRVAESSSPTLTGNAFIGNADTGVSVLSSDVTITKSNIFGNGSTGANCGISTALAGTATLEKICFGAPAGPGADPADAVCGGGVAVGELIDKAFKITPKVPL